MGMDAIVYIGIGIVIGLACGAGTVFFGWTQKLQQDNAKVTAELNAAKETSKYIEDHSRKTEEILIEKFKNLSNDIFEEKTKNFKTQSQESLGLILNPLKERLNDFEKKVNDSFGQQAKEQFSLKEQIKSMVDMNEKITQSADGLTNALKGDSKVQGDWGELQLEKILEDSGLRKGIDYTVQAEGMRLRDRETGAVQKPDVIVNLPDNKHIIIDAKVSLKHYEAYFSSKDLKDKDADIAKFLMSMKKHITDLAQRNYQSTEKLGTPDFVLMFVPIEAAYMLAAQQDPKIHSFAWDKKVVLVSPTTLFATLRTIASVWRLELQNKHAMEIADQGGRLYEKVCGFVEDIQALGKHIETVNNTYEKATNKLSKGQGNILTRTEKLKKLGAKTSKSLPRELLDEEALAKDYDTVSLEDDQEQRRA